ncbi:hypothetical protein EGW08_001527 [Elysia chlorotica]|uniref:Uncharacterized protein n=1 Tax=Elysia chlorotica TaxID=188477 RepID=A0A433UA84_ELYCH|nr:hypothetical protein EGW08_001527 [Elysia chlorotica]
MPRAKKRTPRKSSTSKEVSEAVVEETAASQEPEEISSQESSKVEASEESNIEIDTADPSEKKEESPKNKEETAAMDEESNVDNSEQGNSVEGMDVLDGQSESAETEKTEEGEEMNKSTENSEDPAKKEVSVEDWPVTPLLPHTIPEFVNNKLKEKWEWHMRIYPIDHSDIRRCVLDSVSKIAQETWYYIDKKNFGMGSYDLCMRSFTDTAMVMLKTLRAPMLYRYVTVEVTKRGRNPAEVEKIRQNPPPPTDGSGEQSSEDSEDLIEEAIEKLPYTEILETATLHLDYCHTIQCDKIKGKRKKRSLFVKYLPECTSKELLKVLFPVAINLDIISTGEGRRVGDLDVASDDNLRGVIQAYVTVFINGCKDIGFDWREETLDDGKTNPVSDQESPWQLLPRDDEIPYEAVPLIEKDSNVQYRKKKRDLDIQHRRATELNKRNRSERRRESRWDSGTGSVPVQGLAQLQRAMNAQIQNQLAMIHSVEDRVTRAPRGPPALMGVPPDLLMGPADVHTMRDRKRDRFERDRMDIDMAGRRRDFPPFGPGRMGPPERDIRGRPDFPPRDRDRMFDGGRGRMPMGMYGGRGGHFDRGDSDRGRAFGGRFGGDSRGPGFDFHARGGPGNFDGAGRGRGGFESRGGGRRGESFGQGGMGRSGPLEGTRDEGNKLMKSPTPGKEGGPVERVQNRDQRSGGRTKPVAPSSDKPGDSHRTLTQVTISSDNQGGSRSSGQSDVSKQSGFGNRSYNQGRGNDQIGQRGDSRSFQGQNKGYGSQSQKSFGMSQNQNSLGSQGRQNSFGSSQNRKGNYGSSNNQNRSFNNSQVQNNYGSSQNSQRNFGGSQNQQTSYGSSGYQQSGFGSVGNQQGNFGAIGSQSTSYPLSSTQQNSYSSSTGFGSSVNQQPFGSSQNQQSFGTSQNQQSFGSSQNQQSYGSSQNQQSYDASQNQQSYDSSQNQQASYGSNQQSGYGNQQSNYGVTQNASAQQSGYGGNMQSQAYGNQQGYGSQQQSQGSYGSYNTQQQQGQYNMLQQQNYNTSQSYDSQQQAFGGQGYSTQQQQQMGYSGTGAYDWGQQSSTTGTAAANSGASNYSQSSYGSTQQTQQQDYSAYSTAYPGYGGASLPSGGASLPSAASGYGADSAFANQGLYSASQGNQSANDPYGSYSATDAYGTSAGNQQSGMGAYSYAQYQGSA